jgi:tetratricopeptide (TPR) repeat protein
MPKSTTIKSLFLKDESSFGGLSGIAGALHLVTSQNALDCLAREINEIARRARITRQWELCSRASSAVLSLPVSQGVRDVAEFYVSLSQQADMAEFRKALERMADSAAPAYVARIILEIAYTHDREANLSEALRYYVEAAAAARGTDRLIAAQAAAGMALLRSDDGDHLGSLHNLGRLFSAIGPISHAYPHLYYEYANNLAVVLSRAGRIEEARRAVRVALASPTSLRFPEWQETQEEIEKIARSEPHRIAPTLKPAVATLAVRHKEPRLRIKRQPGLPFICIVRFDLTILQIPLWVWGRYVVSQLDRYVKIARVRAPPVSL